MTTPAHPAPEQDWEASKENFQPLKTGRKAAVLRDSTLELRTQAIEERRRAYWGELAGYSGDDPLEVWLRFIRWTQDTFSAGGHKAELLPLLERCTRELRAAEGGRYRTDIRYLRVWVQYADCLPDPGDVFAFLKEHDIGQDHALYYVAFATYLEARGGFARADATYQQGINRLAAPLDRLRAKFAEFQQRMARRIQRKAQEQAGLEASELDHPERKSLGLLGGGVGRRRRSGMRPGAASGLLGGGTGLKRKAGAENVPDNGLEIFVDDEFCTGGRGGIGGPAASAPAAFLQPGRSAAAGTAWTKLAGFEMGRKENMQQPGVWAGQRLKQAAAHTAPAAPTLEVFADPELQELDNLAASGPDGDGAKPTLRQRLDGGGGAGVLTEEEIMQDPLHLHKTQALPLPRLPTHPAEAPPAKRRREEALAFDEAALLGDSGEELCFEEARAAAWLQRCAAQQQAAEEVSATAAAAAEAELPDMELEGNTCMLIPVAGGPAAEQAAEAGEQQQQRGQEQCASLAPAEQVEVPLVASLPAAFGSPVEMGPLVTLTEAVPGKGAAAEQAARPSPAPRQREALVAEEAGPPMDSTVPVVEPAACQHPPLLQPTPFKQPTKAAGAIFEPTMALSSHDAHAAINQMSGGTLPPTAAPTDLFAVGGSGLCSGLGSGHDPTITIATKDALATLNKMFKGSLPLEHASLPPNPYSAPTLSLGHSPCVFDGGSGNGYEPTMTISTKAAFNAVNSMFRGALPGEHGSLPPTSRGPPAVYDPTVTISTKAAFEAINQMFGSGGCGCTPASQQHQGGTSFRALPPRLPRARQPAAAAPAPVHAVMPLPQGESADSPCGSGGGFCIREDTQFVSVPLSRGTDSPARLAAAAGSVGGNGFAIHEDTQFITVPAGDMAGEDEEEAELSAAQQGGVAASPAAASPMAMAGSGGFLIPEDTQYITVAVLQQDTEGEEAQDEIEATATAEGGQQAFAPLAGTSHPQAAGSFCIREDTQFMCGPAAADADVGGFAIREDTQFLGLGTTAASADNTFPCSSLGGAGSELHGRLGELPRKQPLGKLSGGGGSTGDLLLSGGSGGLLAEACSPAHSANARQVNKWGFAPGANDTLALFDLDLGDTQALLDVVSEAAAADPTAAAQLVAAAGGCDEGGGEDGSSPALALHLQGLHLADCKENLLADPVSAGSGRSLADPAVAAAVLQPLGEARAVELGGIEVEGDKDAVAALESVGLLQDDSFMVCADAEDEGSLPLMGSPAASDGSQTAAAAGRQPPGAILAGATAAATGGGGQGYATPLQQRRVAADDDEQAAASALLDPFSSNLHRRLLACLEPAVAEWPGVYCLSGEEEEEAEAIFRVAAQGGGDSLLELQLCGLEFAVSGCIGQGAYARVFQGVDGDCADVALKLEAPPCPWEWYVCKALAGRVPLSARRHFIDPCALLLGGRYSVLVAPLGPHGSLQDLVNAYLAQQQAPPEVLVMHFAAQLLRIMQHMHAARILHTDIKPDNVLVMLEHGGMAGGDKSADPSLGLQLIDFGRSLDLELLPLGALLQGDSGTDAFRCVEMREGRPWLWQADAYGLAATVHCLLYGRYLEVERVQEATSGAVSLRPCQPLKRQWAGELWGLFFTLLLNHADVSMPPAVDGLIDAFDRHLSGSRDVARQLRQELGRAASLLPRRC